MHVQGAAAQHVVSWLTLTAVAKLPWGSASRSRWLHQKTRLTGTRPSLIPRVVLVCFWMLGIFGLVLSFFSLFTSSASAPCRVSCVYHGVSFLVSGPVFRWEEEGRRRSGTGFNRELNWVVMPFVALLQISHGTRLQKTAPTSTPASGRLSAWRPPSSPRFEVRMEGLPPVSHSRTASFRRFFGQSPATGPSFLPMSLLQFWSCEFIAQQ